MTRMVSSSLAPLLSATLSRLSCWITGGLPDGKWSSSLLHHLDHAPPLVLGDGTRLHEGDQVADPALVTLVVRLEVLTALNDLLVERMAAQVGDLHHHGLVHLVRDHAPGPHLAGSPRRALLDVRHASSSSLDALRPRRRVGALSASVAGPSSVVVSSETVPASASAVAGSPAAAAAEVVSASSTPASATDPAVSAASSAPSGCEPASRCSKSPSSTASSLRWCTTVSIRAISLRALRTSRWLSCWPTASLNLSS